MPRNPTTGVFTRVSNSFSDPVDGTVIDPVDATTYYNDVDGGITDSVAPPVSSTDNAIARFDGATGKFIQNSTVTVSDTGDVVAPGTIETDINFIENNSSTHAYRIQARTLGALAFPVPSFQPIQANSPLAVDLMPSGPVPVEAPGNGFTWIDMCDADIMTSNVNPVNCARVAMTSTGAQFGCFNFNGAVAKPIEFVVGSGGGTAIKGRIDGNGLLTMGLGADSPVFASQQFIANGGVNSGFSARNSTDHTEFFAIASNTGIFMGSATNHSVTIRTNNANRATFDTSGNLSGLLSLQRTGGVAIQGTNTNDSAAAGYVGETISSSVTAGSAVALTTGTAANVTSISLTAGDWMVTAQGYVTMAAATSYTNVNYSGSSTSATQDFAPGRWINFSTPAAVIGNTHITFGAVTYRLSLASTTTVYLVATSTFTISTAAAWGAISGRRMR